MNCFSCYFSRQSGGVRKHNFWTARVKSIKNYIFEILTSRPINWYINGSIRGGVVGGVSRCGFSWGSLQFFLGHFHENLNIRILSSSPVDCHPFWADWVKGGSVEMFKSQRHTRSGAGRGVSQANGAAIHSKLPGLCQHEIVSRIAKKWKQCGLCKPVMGAW